jgi:ABC-2 type transport system permease protein
MMILSILRKELRENLREGRFRIALLTLVVLTGLSVWVSQRYYQSVNEQYREARNNSRQEWVGQGQKNPHSAAHYGTHAFKPKYPLSLIDNGVDKYSGVSIFLEAHKRSDAQYLAAQDQTALSRFGDLTPDFILLFIIPLFIILIGFNSFTREREHGTLRLLVSQGIPLPKLLFGKWLALYIPVALVVLALFTLAGIFLSNLSEYGQMSWAALAVLLLVYLTYYAVFTNITLLVSASVRSSSLAFVVLLGIWVLSCLAMPKGSSTIADSLYPYPTQMEFEQEISQDKKAGLNGHEPWNAAAQKLETETLQKYGVDRVEQLPFNWDGFLMQQGEEHEAEIYFEHYHKLKETYAQQTRVYQSLAVISPFLPTRFLSMGVCHTDYHAHWDFADAAEKYRLLLVGKLNGDMVENSRTGEWDYLADERLWSSVPEFDYQPLSYASILKFNGVHILTLVGWLLLTGIAMVFTVKRLSVI